MVHTDTTFVGVIRIIMVALRDKYFRKKVISFYTLSKLS